MIFGFFAMREPATEADSAEMARLAAQAIKAGALGFTTSRTILHKSSDGHHTPTLGAAEAELTTIAKGLGDIGMGVLQLVSDFDDTDNEFAMLRRIVEASGRPLSLTLLHFHECYSSLDNTTIIPAAYHPTTG